MWSRRSAWVSKHTVQLPMQCLTLPFSLVPCQVYCVEHLMLLSLGRESESGAQQGLATVRAAGPRPVPPSHPPYHPSIHPSWGVDGVLRKGGMDLPLLSGGSGLSASLPIGAALAPTAAITNYDERLCRRSRS